MSSSNDSDMELTPNFINQEAKAVVENLLPEASNKRYIKSYDDFMKWRTENLFCHNTFFYFPHIRNEK